MNRQTTAAGTAVHAKAASAKDASPDQRDLEDCLNEMRSTLIRFAVATYGLGR